MHRSVALRGASPTTYPPQSNEGQSSSSQAVTVVFHEGGSRSAYLGALIVFDVEGIYAGGARSASRPSSVSALATAAVSSGCI